LYRPAPCSDVWRKKRQVDELTSVQIRGNDWIFLSMITVPCAAESVFSMETSATTSTRSETSPTSSPISRWAGRRDIHGKACIVKASEALGAGLDIVAAGWDQRENTFSVRTRFGVPLRARREIA
jgi:hypothetical protein